MDRQLFFDKIRASLFGGALSGAQVSGIEAILTEAERRNELVNNVAYALATTQHETASTMQPIREYGKGKGRRYGVPAGPYRHVYYGRGLVQLTWLFNYEKAKTKLGYDFVRYPDAVMDPKWAVRILFDGMAEGWFTGKSFKTFIDTADEADAEDGHEYTSARKIINGTDKAKLIAGYALRYEAALRTAGYGLVDASKPIPRAPEADKAPTPTVKPSAWVAWFAIFKALFMGVK